MTGQIAIRNRPVPSEDFRKIELNLDLMEEEMRENDLLVHKLSPGSAVEKAMLILDSDRESALYNDWLHASDVEKALGGSNNAEDSRLVIEEAPMLHDDIWLELDTHLQETGELGVPDTHMGEATYSVNESSASIRTLQGALLPGTSGILQPGGEAGHISKQTTSGKYKTWTVHSHSIDPNSESSSCERAGSTADNAEVCKKSPTGYQAEQLDPLWPQTQQVNEISGRADKRCRLSVEERAVRDTELESMGVLMGETSEGVSSTGADETFHRKNSQEPASVSADAPGEEIVRYRATRSSLQPDRARLSMCHQSSFRLERWDAVGAGRVDPEAVRKSIMLRTAGQLLDASKSAGQSRWAELLLNLCAAAIASKNVARTQHLMWVLNDLGSFTGDANERLAAYGLKALFCRITGGMEAAATYVKPLHHSSKRLGAKMMQRALLKFNDVTPWHTISYAVCNATLLEAFAGRNRLHIVDIGVCEGIQWPTFMDSLVSRTGGPPAALRITTIQDQRKDVASGKGQVSTQHGEFMSRLVKFARLLGLQLELNMLSCPLEYVTRQDLKLREGEVLAVCAQFRLHRLSEEIVPNIVPSLGSPKLPSRPRNSPRDAFLEFLFRLEPNVLVLGENDVDHLSPDFLTRFQATIKFWWAYYESASLAYKPKDEEDRQVVDYECGMLILNNTACEGVTRIERNETHAGWRARLMKTGFVPMELSEETKKAAHSLIQKSCDNWEYSVPEKNCLSMLWRQQPVSFCSVWKTPSCSRSLCKCSMLHN